MTVLAHTYIHVYDVHANTHVLLHCTPHARAPLQKADTDKSGSLSFDEFAALFKELSHRPEIEVLFTKYASSHDFMTAADLRMFLMGEQSACLQVEECQKLVKLYEPTDEGKASGRMSLDGEQYIAGAAVVDSDLGPAVKWFPGVSMAHMLSLDAPTCL